MAILNLLAFMETYKYSEFTDYFDFAEGEHAPGGRLHGYVRTITPIDSGLIRTKTGSSFQNGSIT